MEKKEQRYGKGYHFLALEAKKDLELSTLLCNFATEYI